MSLTRSRSTLAGCCEETANAATIAIATTTRTRSPGLRRLGPSSRRRTRRSRSPENRDAGACSDRALYSSGSLTSSGYSSSLYS
jgi:hypothetical protein